MDAASLFCDEFGAAISLSDFRLGWVELRNALAGGGDVNLGDVGGRDGVSLNLGLRVSDVISNAEGCGGGFFADIALWMAAADGTGCEKLLMALRVGLKS